MNKLETIWDCDKHGWQSIVQKFQDRVYKIYPQDKEVTREILSRYIEYQNNLPDFRIPTNHADTKLWGLSTIALSFTKISKDIADISIIYPHNIHRDTQSWVISEIWYVEGESLAQWHPFGVQLIEEIRDFLQFHEDKKISLLHKFIYATNFKIVGEENGTIYMVWTDCSSHIPRMVDELLNIKDE